MTTAVVPAAGRGRRFEGSENKLFLRLRQKPILVWVLETLEAVCEVEAVVVCVRPEVRERVERLISELALTKIRDVVCGGEERQDSVYNALESIDRMHRVEKRVDYVDYVVIHDAVRPLARVNLFERVIAAAKQYRAATAALPCSDTVKWSEETGFAAHTLPRQKLFQVQTPQAFEFSLLRQAHERARREGFLATDDAALVERMGVKVRLVEGEPENIKITVPTDLLIAEAILSALPLSSTSKGEGGREGEPETRPSFIPTLRRER